MAPRLTRENIEAARSAGYSDAEIRSWLMSQPDALAEARGAGYSDPEIMQYFGLAAPPPPAPAGQGQWGPVDSIVNGLTLGAAVPAQAFATTLGQSPLFEYLPEHTLEGQAAHAKQSPAFITIGRPQWQNLINSRQWREYMKPGEDEGPAEAERWNALRPEAPGVISAPIAHDFWSNYEQNRQAILGARADQGLAGNLLEIGASIPTTIAAAEATPGIAALRGSGNLAARVVGSGAEGAEAGVLQTGIVGGDPGENALGGMAVGTMFPIGGSLIRRALLPRVNPEVLESARRMEAQGVNLRPSQLAMSETMRKADQFLASGGNEEQLRDFTRAVSRTFGADADALTPAVMDQALADIQHRMNGLVSLTHVTWDQPLATLKARLAPSLRGVTESGKNQVIDVLDHLKDSFDPATGRLSGEAYQNLTNRGGSISNLMHSSEPAVRRAGGKIRDELDAAVGRSAGPDVASEWDEARSQIKNLYAVEPLVEKAQPTGIVNPRLLPSAVIKNFNDYGWTSPGDLATLSEGGKFLGTPTAAGDVVGRERMPWYTRPGVIFPTVAGEGALAYFNPKAAAIIAGSAAVGATGKALAGRALRSDWYRNMLLQTQPPSWLSRGALPAATGALNLLTNPQPRAAGGPVSAGQPYVVGEHGPEIIYPDSDGTVLPNGAFSATPWATPSPMPDSPLLPYMRPIDPNEKPNPLMQQLQDEIERQVKGRLLEYMRQMEERKRLPRQ